MKIRIRADGRTLEGCPTELARQMQELAFVPPGLELSHYIDWAVAQARAMLGVELEVSGSSEQERAQSFVTAMLAAQLADELVEPPLH